MIWRLLMDIDITQALKDTENALRDFISVILRKKHGENWIENCGVPEERINKWKERKIEEKKRQKFAVVEERLIYYADFYDIKTILHKNWQEFSEAFGDWKIMEVWLDELGRLRDPEAHRRELLPHQKHRALGIEGEIRTRLVRYRSKKETEEDYFPRIESARDSFGNIWTSDMPGHKSVYTETILRPNDIADFVVTASDPMGDELEYGIEIAHQDKKWQRENSFSITILEDHIKKLFSVELYIRSPRKHHAYRSHDDSIDFFILSFLLNFKRPGRRGRRP
jgi:hypothetical protein